VNKKMLALYGLKWNPFQPDVPIEALHVSRRTESFCWRAEQLVGEGGFALVTGAPGTGKSVTLRILAERLGSQRDVKVGIVPALLPAGSLPGGLGTIGPDLYVGTLTVVRNPDQTYWVQYQGERQVGGISDNAKLNVVAVEGI